MIDLGDWCNGEWFFYVALVFSMVAPARTSGNVLYGLYTCNLDGSMLRWPIQLPIAAEHYRFLEHESIDFSEADGAVRGFGTWRGR